MSAFCSICTGERGPFVQRPLGKGGALVTVCRACDEDAAREKRGPEIARDLPDEDERTGCHKIQAKALATLAKMGAPKIGHRDRRKTATAKGATFSRTPGWILVRVRWDRLDLREAIATLRDKPWFRELRYLGIQAPWYLFERPDPEVAAGQRRTSTAQLVGELDLFRVK